MAFSNAQKSKIRAYLGFPDLHLSANPRLEGGLEVAGADSDTQTEVESLLTKLAAVEVAIDTNAIDTAGLSSVGTGDPEFYKGQQLNDLKRIGRGLVAKLSIKLGIPVVSDYFGSTGYGGDAWGGRAFQLGIFDW